MMPRLSRAVLTALFATGALLIGALCFGQGPAPSPSPSPSPAPTPDHRGEIRLDAPEYKGVRANAPIPTRYHIRNEGGSNGAGLCVIASILCNGMYQQVPGLEGGKQSALWRTAKSRPGGYSPDKLERLLREVMPQEKWVSYYGPSPTILDELSGRGYPIGVTMNTGAQYGYRPIAHMVSLAHYQSGGLACVIDNNDPGKYHWMPAAEFLRRWYSGGNGWAFAWSRLPATARVVAGTLALLLLAAALLLLAAATALTGWFGLSLIGTDD